MGGGHVTVKEARGRQYASTGSKWEPIVGYSRAVRTGATITVTGTVGIHPDGSYPVGIEAQARRAFEIVQAAIEALGGQLTDVVRTRMFVTDIREWKALGKVHGSIFGEVRPATTMLQISRLIDEEALVEVEADAIILNR